MSLQRKERTFKVTSEGKEEEFKIVRPTFAQSNKADRLYKKAFSEAIKDGVMTAFQMRETIDEIDYFKSANGKIKEFDVIIKEIEDKLTSTEDKEAGLPLVYKIQEMRARRMIELFKVDTLYQQTAEAYAENLRNQFYASELTVDVNGKRVWASFDRFEDDSTSDLGQFAVRNVMLFNAKITNDFQMDLPENKWLLSKGVIDAEGVLINEPKVEEQQVFERPKFEEVPIEDTLGEGSM